jgi:hypothetical protein
MIKTDGDGHSNSIGSYIHGSASAASISLTPALNRTIV